MNEIILYGTVGEDLFGTDYFTASQVRADLKGKKGPLKVRLNSGGGIASEGQAIYHILKDYPGFVTIEVEGVAASAASLIAMAGDKIIMRAGAWMLVHDPASMFTNGRGTADDHQGAASMLNKIGTGYAEIYAGRTGKSVEAVREIMRAETVYTGAEAVAAGFADEVEDLQAVAAAPFAYGMYRNAPAELRAAAVGRLCPTTRKQKAVAAIIAGLPAYRESEEMLDHENAGGKPDQAAQAATITQPTMTAAQTSRLHALAEKGCVPSATVAKIVAENTTFEAALDQLTEAWAGKDDQRAMPGASTYLTPGGMRLQVGADWAGPEGFRAKAVAGLAARLDPKGEHSGLAREGAQMTIPEIAMAVCRMQGLSPFNEHEAVRMATHSTSDFPMILENSLSNAVARRIEQRAPDIARASHEVQRDDYRQGRSLTLSATGKPMEVGEGGEIQFTTAEEKGELLPRIRDFASGFNLTNQALQNDATALGVLAQMGDRMAQGAVERLRDVLIEPIIANSGAGQTMADGLAMFHADHGNLAAEGATLTVTSLSTARLAMRKQTGINGELYAVEPWALVVPAELETQAQQVLAQIDATKFSDANPFSNTLELIVEPGLIDPGAWYMIGDPARYDGLAHAFLDGQSSPRIESRPGWNTLGMEMRLIWALDAKFIETATWFKTPAPSGG